jgi:putative aldouronate transport system substrate-binding protein
MKKVKKLIVLFFCIVLVTIQFASCVTTQKKEASQDVETSKAEKPSEETQKIHKLTLLGPDRRSDSYPNEEWEEYNTWKELNKLMKAYNLELKYDFVPKEQYEVVVKTKLASATDLPDVINLNPVDDSTALTLGKQGILLELNSLVDKYSNGNIRKTWKERYYIISKMNTTPEGDLYWFPGVSSTCLNEDGTAALGTGWCANIRKDWLEKFNISLPTTAEEFYEAVKYFRENDANGNGQKDEIILVPINVFNNSIAQWFGISNMIVNIDPTTNKAVTPWYQPAIKDYINYMKRLVNEKIIDASLLGASADVTNQKLTQNKLSAIHYYIANIAREKVMAEFSPELKTAEYQPYLPLKAIDGITPYFLREPAMTISGKYGITKNCKDLDGAVAFFDMVYSKEYQELCELGVEGETYKIGSDGKPVYLTLTMSSKELIEKKISLR